MLSTTPLIIITTEFRPLTNGSNLRGRQDFHLVFVFGLVEAALTHLLERRLGQNILKVLPVVEKVTRRRVRLRPQDFAGRLLRLGFSAVLARFASQSAKSFVLHPWWRVGITSYLTAAYPAGPSCPTKISVRAVSHPLVKLLEERGGLKSPNGQPGAFKLEVPDGS